MQRHMDTPYPNPIHRLGIINAILSSKPKSLLIIKGLSFFFSYRDQNHYSFKLLYVSYCVCSVKFWVPTKEFTPCLSKNFCLLWTIKPNFFLNVTTTHWQDAFRRADKKYYKKGNPNQSRHLT